MRHGNLKTTIDVYTNISENRDIDTANRLNEIQPNHSISHATVIDFEEYKASRG